MKEAVFHNVDGRTVRIVQLMPSGSAAYAAEVDGDEITFRPMIAWALVEVEHPGHGPEQDVVPLALNPTGEVEIASDWEDYGGVFSAQTKVSCAIAIEVHAARRGAAAVDPGLPDIGAYQSGEEENDG